MSKKYKFADNDKIYSVNFSSGQVMNGLLAEQINELQFINILNFSYE